MQRKARASTPEARVSVDQAALDGALAVMVAAGWGVGFAEKPPDPCLRVDLEKAISCYLRMVGGG